MKIVIGSSILGIHRELPPYVSYLLETDIFKKHQIKVLPYGTQKPNERMIEKFLTLPIKLFYFIINVLRYKPQIIHLNSAFDRRAIGRDIIFLLFLKLFKQKVCIEFHGTDIEWFSNLSKSTQLFIIKYLKKFDMIFFLSYEERGYFIENFNISKNSTIVKIPIKGVSTIDINNNISTIDINNNNLLFIGRLFEKKGIIELLEAVNQITKNNINCKLFIAGDGKLKDYVNNFIIENNLGGVIKYLGWITNKEVLAQYRNASIFILPTYHQEGLPIVILMALQFGIPIITTKIRGMADYLKEFDNCLWVEPRNHEMLAEKIIYLFKHPELRKQMSLNNIELSKQFLADKVAKEFINIYEKILYG